MIEELTPLVLMSTMVLVILVSSCLTLALSALLMWRYRHAVAQAMAETAGFGTSTVAGGSAEPFPSGDPEFRSRTIAPRGADLYHRAMRAPWHNAARYAIAGLAFALVLAAAVLAALTLAQLCQRYLVRTFGGLTGDMLGALIELATLGFLVVAGIGLA